MEGPDRRLERSERVALARRATPSLIRGMYPVVYAQGHCWHFALALEDLYRDLPGGGAPGDGLVSLRYRDFHPWGAKGWWAHVALRRDGWFMDARGILDEADFMTGYDGLDLVPARREEVEAMAARYDGETAARGFDNRGRVDAAVRDWAEDVRELRRLPPSSRPPSGHLVPDRDRWEWQSREAWERLMAAAHHSLSRARRTAARRAARAGLRRGPQAEAAPPEGVPPPVR